MTLRELRLRTFRNLPRLDWTIGSGVHVLTGANAQGKTNLLESIYLLSTMKSFRGATHHEMIQEGKKGYFIGAHFQAETDARIKFYWSPRERKLTLNEEPVASLADYLGVVKTVVFSSADIQLVRGSGRFRRRFIDLICCQTKPGYLLCLQNYSKAVKSRNLLLKRRPADPRLLASFSNQVVHLGNQIMEERKNMIPKISPMARLAFRQISKARDEELIIEYQPSVRQDFAHELERHFPRDSQSGSTGIGPHRDDILFKIQNRDADRYASEGQQRSLVLSLKMAQTQILKGLFGYSPILLIDDVMGELDPARKEAFLPLLHHAQSHSAQVFMTTTETTWPGDIAKNWTFWSLQAGQLSHFKPAH